MPPPRPDRRRALRLAAALPITLALAGCGFEPVHAPGRGAEATRGRIAVDPIDGAAGFALNERLSERLGLPVAPTHRLAVDLELRSIGTALTLDNVTTRYTVEAVAAYSLFPIGALEPILTDTVSARTGYSAPATGAASAFAARAAGRDAERRVARELADRIALRLALAARGLGVPTADPGPGTPL